MEKKEKVENNEEIKNDGVEAGEVYEKSAKFSELGKKFIEPDEAEMTQEEAILKSKDKDVTKEEKEALITALKYLDKWSKKYEASEVRWHF